MEVFFSIHRLHPTLGNIVMKLEQGIICHPLIDMDFVEKGSKRVSI